MQTHSYASLDDPCSSQRWASRTWRNSRGSRISDGFPRGGLASQGAVRDIRLVLQEQVRLLSVAAPLNHRRKSISTKPTYSRSVGPRVPRIERSYRLSKYVVCNSLHVLSLRTEISNSGATETGGARPAVGLQPAGTVSSCPNGGKT